MGGINYREYKLYEPIKIFFESQGFSIYPEIPLLYSCIDIVAIKDNIIIAIEMKMSLSKKVIRQAWTHNIFADYTYVAIPTNPRNPEKCIKRKIGIIQVKNDIAKILYKAPKNDKFYGNYRQQLIKRCLESDNKIAGLPVVRGVGPRIDCKKRVKEYLKNNPNATWKQIYKDVSNHYCNHNSMRSAIGKINMGGIT